ncbi:MAG TPA: hypothetical protein VHO50_03375 [Bacteroidales bacterium]|nr:hypothetical protein [Bacteroidales bacterium]
MKNLFLVIIVLFLLINCERSEKKEPVMSCNVENPLEDLPWLKELKNTLTGCTCEISIIQALYQNETVFYTTLTDYLCDGVFHVELMDCSGAVIKEYNIGNAGLFNTEVTELNVIHKCK